MSFTKLKFTIALLLLLPLLISCSLSPIAAQDRGFLDLHLEFLSEYQLPKQEFQGTPVGGLSGITYDRRLDRFYAISDDRGDIAPARFYTLKLAINDQKLTQIDVEKVTFLQDATNQNYGVNAIDPEGIALSPAGSVFITNEGTNQAAPSIQDYDLETGNTQQFIPIPQRYLVDSNQGIQPNLGFEALAIAADGNTKSDPYRIFTATESALVQDLNPDNPDQLTPIRLLHYLITDTTPPLLISENLYQLDPAPQDAIFHGLTDLVALPERGFFLSLERSYGLLGASAKIYQITTGTATDTSSIPSLRVLSPSFQPIRKKLVLDLETLGIKLENLEGMSLGARLADGNQSLILVSDDNFSPEQTTQFLLFSIGI